MISIATPHRASSWGAEGRQVRLRVLQVITKLDMGGAEVIALDLVSALHRAIDFAVATVLDVEPTPVGRTMRAQLAQHNIPIFPGARGHYKKGGALIAAWRLARAVSHFQPDVVHLHTEMPELTWAIARMLFPWTRRVAMVRTVHNSELWIAWGGIGRWVTDRLAAACAVAVSQAAAEADAAIGTRWPRPQAEVIYNGARVPPPLLGGSAASGSQVGDGSAMGTAKAAVSVLFAGRLIAQKGPDLLPAILASAHAACPRADVKVQIAGTGPLESGLRAALDGIAPGWVIEMTPPIGGLSLRLREFDVVLMPSRFEGFSVLALETLLSGVPLVATRAPGLVEALPADYPFCAEVDDAQMLGLTLARVLQAPRSAQQKATAFVPELTSRFAPEAMIARYCEIYQEEHRRRAA